MNPSQKLLLVTILLGLISLAGCGKSSGQSCIDRVADKCSPIAKRECNLSGSPSQTELEQCAAYSSCKNSVMMGCASQN